MLARKERTTAEVRDWLADRGASDDEASGIIERLEEALVLDDERFAVEFARDKRELAGWGQERIGKALARRGIEAVLIEAAQAGEEATEVERATEILVERGFRFEDPAERRRALGVLARKGFSAEDAYEAIRRAARLEGHDLEDPDVSDS